MAQSWAVDFYHSKQWVDTRMAYMSLPIQTDHGVCPPGMCERCFEMGKLTSANTVHHIEWLTPSTIDDTHKTLDFSNLMRVCMDCHAAIHAGIPAEKPRVAFDEEGNVIPVAHS